MIKIINVVRDCRVAWSSFGLWEPETPVQIRAVPFLPALAQLAERWTVDPNVAGSSPAGGISIYLFEIIYFL